MDSAGPAAGAVDPKVDQELLILTIVLLVFLGGADGVVLGWGMNKAAQWVISGGTPDRLQILAYIKRFALFAIPVVAFNAVVGAVVARRLSLPIIRMRRAMIETTRGNLEYELDLPPGALLDEYTAECRKMIETLRRLTYRDHESARLASDLLGQCQKAVAENPPAKAEERQRIENLLNQARAQLSVINYHFTKGRREQA